MPFSDPDYATPAAASPRDPLSYQDAVLEDLYGQLRCDICGEKFKLSDEVAECVDPASNANPMEDSVNDHMIVHAQCMIDHGYEMA